VWGDDHPPTASNPGPQIEATTMFPASNSAKKFADTNGFAKPLAALKRDSGFHAWFAINATSDYHGFGTPWAAFESPEAKKKNAFRVVKLLNNPRA